MVETVVFSCQLRIALLNESVKLPIIEGIDQINSKKIRKGKPNQYKAFKIKPKFLLILPTTSLNQATPPDDNGEIKRFCLMFLDTIELFQLKVFVLSLPKALFVHLHNLKPKSQSLLIQAGWQDLTCKTMSEDCHSR